MVNLKNSNQSNPNKDQVMEYEKLLDAIADEVLNEHWSGGNNFKEPTLEAYDEYMIKRLPKIELCLESKLFKDSGIEGEIAKQINNLMTNHPDIKKREKFNLKDWMGEIAEIAKYRRENSCC